MWGWKIDCQTFVDQLLLIVFKPTIGCISGLRTFSQQRPGDADGFGSGYANDTYTATTGWRSDRSDSIRFSHLSGRLSDSGFSATGFDAAGDNPLLGDGKNIVGYPIQHQPCREEHKEYSKDNW